MQTTINVEQDGKLVSWSDKLKGDVKTEYEQSSEHVTESSTQSLESSGQPSPENTSNSAEQF